ncbi:hypothetical protein [Mesorhizobium sp. A623]
MADPDKEIDMIIDEKLHVFSTMARRQADVYSKLMVLADSQEHLADLDRKLIAGLLDAREKLTLAANQPGPHALFRALDDYEAKLLRLEAHVEQFEVNAVEVEENLCPGF